MKKAYEYFLTLAKTLHFSRTADQLYISQQALSDQIRRLETELNTQLFIRKPKLKLTPAGKLLERTLYDIQRMEDNLYAQLSDLSKGSRGNIYVGMHIGRMRILFPQILNAFAQRYPNVRVHMISDQTSNYKVLIDEGQIDFFFGINFQESGSLVSDVIAYEPMYLVAHPVALRQVFGPDFAEKAKAFQQGIDVQLFRDIPFIFAAEISQGQIAINKYLARKGCQLNVPLVLNDYTIQYQLLSIIHGACFCFKMLLPMIAEYNSQLPEAERLYAFPLEDFQEKLKLSLVRHSSSFFPAFTQVFYDITREHVLNIINQ